MKVIGSCFDCGFLFGVASNRSNRKDQLPKHGVAFAILDVPRCGDLACAERGAEIDLR